MNEEIPLRYYTYVKLFETIVNSIKSMSDFKDLFGWMEKLPKSEELPELLQIMLSVRVASIYALAIPLLKIYGKEIDIPTIPDKLTLKEAIIILEPLLTELYKLTKELELMPEKIKRKKPHERILESFESKFGKQI